MMGLHPKVLIVTSLIVAAIMILVLGIWIGYGALASMIGITQQNNITGTFSSSAANLQSPIKIGDPVIQRGGLNFRSNGGNASADFISYEDFPIHLAGNLHTNNLKVANKPSNVWMKFINGEESSEFGEDNETILRVAGAVKPLVPNNFNTTIYIANSQEGEILGISSLPLVQNGIINEMAIVRENIPIKFKEVVVQAVSQGNIFVYGLINDHNAFGLEFDTSETMPMNDLEVNIEPIGIMINGNLSGLPEWLEIRTTNLPISLTENIPEYYGIMLATLNAPAGSYEIAFRETINSNEFIETMTVIIPNTT
jgi:hypothetical protein